MAGNTVAAWAAKQNPNVKVAYTLSTGLVWALAFRMGDNETRNQISNALKCLKQDGTISRLAEKWFGFTPAADSVSVVVGKGQGVPGFSGYDPTPVTLNCK